MDAVKKAYSDAEAAERQAVIARPDKIRSVLQPYIAPGPYLDFLVRGDLEVQDKGQIPWGTGTVLHPTKVTINGTNATVEDCQDTGNAGMADKATGHLIPGTRGVPHQTAVAKLVLGADQRWLLSEVRTYTRPCTRPS